MPYRLIQKLFGPKISLSGFARAFKNHFGFIPREENYYRIAFTHRSDAYEESYHLAGAHNERLEFLGDAVISTIVSDFLFKKFPQANEGSLTKMRSKLVKRDNLNEWAKLFDIPSFLKHDKGLTLNQQFKETVYGNAFEAFVGAMYLDQGFLFTSNFLNKHILNHQVDLDQLLKEESNFKSRLIEWGQKNKKQIKFQITSAEDSDKNSIFQALVYVEGEKMGTGEAKRKKEAEQLAAQNALNQLEGFDTSE